jgi:hypothetical protein
MWTDGGTERHYKAKCRSLHFCECAKKVTQDEYDTEGKTQISKGYKEKSI